jgi:DNA polymerase-3 subunit delta'
MAHGGVDAIRTELARALAGDKLHGAYLFEGPEGTGRRATALWLARMLLCKQPGEREPCGVCRGCRLLGAGADPAADPGDARPSHPDLHWVEPDGGRIKIEAIRELRAALGLTANERGRRVGLIFEAEKLRVEAANALLKTLEEPPANTVLVLVATSARTLPRTVVSRTLRVRFPSWTESERAAALTRDGMDERDASLAASLGGASPDAARHWAEESLEPAREMQALLAGIAKLGVGELLDFAETFRRPGEEGRDRARLYTDVQSAFAREQAEVAAHGDDSRALERWLRAFESASRARAELERRNLNPQLLVESLLLELRASAG